MKNLLLLVFILFGSCAEAYPIFFSCDANKNLSSVLTPNELATRLNALAAAEQGRPGFNQISALEQACKDYDDCVRQFGRLMDLSGSMGALGRDAIIQQVAQRTQRVTSEMRTAGVLRVSDSEMSFAAQFNRLQTKTYACRATQEESGAELMKRSNGSCTVANLNHSPYMYVTGYRVSGEPSGENKRAGSGAPLCEDIDGVITGAVAMGQDPYAALAVAFMEQGTEIEGLYLDPIGKVQALGCAFTPVSGQRAGAWDTQNAGRISSCFDRCTEAQRTSMAAESQSSNSPWPTSFVKDVKKFDACKSACEAIPGRPYNFKSYTTPHNVQFRAVQNTALANRLRDYATLKGAKIEPENSFLCSGADGITPSSEARSDLSSTPRPNECCLQLNFRSDAETLGKGLTFTSLQGYVRSPLPANRRSSAAGEAPARRLQRFNGWSPLMGGAEVLASAAWRSGVNYNRTPAYGYQAMDFILNSLMPNPYIAAKIKEAQERLNHKSPSVLCEDVPAGSYTVDSGFYSRAHGNAPRMGTIQARWDSGARNWAQLTKAQQNVLKNEFSATCLARTRTELLGVLGAARAPQLENYCNSVSVPPSYFKKDEPDTQARTQELTNAYGFYMASILPLRRTVAEAAKQDLGYSWQEMTDVQFNLLRQTVSDASRVPSSKRKGGSIWKTTPYPTNMIDDSSEPDDENCPNCETDSY